MTEKNITVSWGQPMSSFGGAFGSGLDGSSGGRNVGNAPIHSARGAGLKWADDTKRAKMAFNDAYTREARNMPTTVAILVSSSKADTTGFTPVQALLSQVDVYDKLIAQKVAELESANIRAKEFNGGDPFTIAAKDILEKSKTIPSKGKHHSTLADAQMMWDRSYRAGKEALLLSEMISLLTIQSVSVKAELAVAREDERLKDAQDRASRKEVPIMPPGVSLDKNMQESKDLRLSAKLVVGGENAIVYGVFYTKVKNGAAWDYKQNGRQYEEFGNFNYGATGTAAGIPEQILLRAAGAAQHQAGTSKEDFDNWWGDTPYGDDKVDQVWIKAGIDFAKAKGF